MLQTSWNICLLSKELDPGPELIHEVYYYSTSFAFYYIFFSLFARMQQSLQLEVIGL